MKTAIGERELKEKLAKYAIQNIQLNEEIEACEQTRQDLELSIEKLQVFSYKLAANSDSLIHVNNYLSSSNERLNNQVEYEQTVNDALRASNEKLEKQNRRRRTGGRIFKATTAGLLILLLIR